MSISNDSCSYMYSAGDVAAAAGISNTVLQQWCSRGLVKFGQVKLGGRSFRKFSLANAVSATLMYSLRKLGVNPTEAKDVVTTADAGILQRILLTRDEPNFTGFETARYLLVYRQSRYDAESESVIIEDAHATAMFCRPTDIFESISRLGRAFLLVDLDEIIQATIKGLELSQGQAPE